jgi:hypothetical protein
MPLTLLERAMGFEPTTVPRGSADFANDGRSEALASLFSACLETRGDDPSGKSMVVAVARPRNQFPHVINRLRPLPAELLDPAASVVRCGRGLRRHI